MNDRIRALNAKIEHLRAENLVLQDRLSEHVGPVTEDERLDLVRLRVSYHSLAHQYERMCRRIEELTGRDPRLHHLNP